MISMHKFARLVGPFFPKIDYCFRSGVGAFRRLEPEAKRPMLASRRDARAARASFINIHVVDAAEQEFDDIDGVEVTRRPGFFVIDFFREAHVRFKKLDASLRYGNVSTNQQAQWIEQMPLFGTGSPTNIVAGYQFNEDEEDIVRVAITCSTAEGLAWSIVLPDYVSGDGTGVGTVLPTPPKDGPTHIVKEEKRRERGAKKGKDENRRGG